MKSLFISFKPLEEVVKVFEDAQQYDRDLSRYLNKIKNRADSSSENENDYSPIKSEELEFGLIKLEDLINLEARGKNIRIKVDQMEEFSQKIKSIKSSEDYCINLIQENLGPDSPAD